MIRQVAIALAAIAFACTSALPQAARAVETIPFTNDDGLIHVQVSVDGQPAVPMLVDLGAGVDILSERMAHLVSFTRKYTTMRLTGERVDLPMGNVVTLDLGSHRIGDPEVGVWRGLYSLRGVDGLISAVAFRNVATTFDFHEHQLVIEDAVSYADRKRNGTRVGLVLQDDLDTAVGVFARFDIGNGRTALCEIDTGAKGITFDKVFEPRGVPSLTLIDAPQTKIDKPNVKFADLIYDCTIGNDFWGNRNFTLDVLNKALWVAQQI
jgi:hypothetical protein